MQFFRFMVGIRFNHKTFRLANKMGEIADKILGDNVDTKHFESITQSRDDLDKMYLHIFDKNQNNVLTLTSSDIIFKKKNSEENCDISPSLALREFKDHWNTINKIMNYGTARRIGLVGEFRALPPEGEKDISRFLAEKLTTLNAPNRSRRFKLTYEDREKIGVGPFNESIDEYWNTIYNFYPSELDELPNDKTYNLNIDVQRYYNPAIRNVLNELNTVKERFKQEKDKLDLLARDLGVVNGQ